MVVGGDHDHRQRVAAGFQCALEDRTCEHWEDEYRLLRSDGSVANVLDRGFILRDASGKPTRMVGAMQDITQRQRADQALRAFARKLDQDIEAERKRLSREVHDQIGQIYTALKLKLLACRPGTVIVPSMLAGLDELLDEGIQVARRISADLRPAMLDDLGLGPALEQYACQLGARMGLAVEVALAPDPRLGPAQATQLFRIAQEAITNVIRHAEAHRVRLRGWTGDGHYTLLLEDDGKGMDPAAAEGLGLLGMRERADLVGATLRLGRSELGGTSITLSLPLIEEEDEE